MSLDVQERQAQESMEPSPQDIPNNEDDYEGEFDESRQNEELSLDNLNKNSEEIEVATPDVIITNDRDGDEGKGLQLTDLKEDTPSTIPNQMEFK